MTPYRFYIQQLHFDGQSYQKGNVADTLEVFGAVCKSFTDEFMPEPKTLATRDWPGEDGLEVYFPKTTPIKEFDVDAEFIITSKPGLDDDSATTDAIERRRNFIKFLYGRNTGATGSRLAIYDEHSKTGYKDVGVKKVSPTTSERQQGANEAIYELKVTFTVYDPVTEVIPGLTNGKVTELKW